MSAASELIVRELFELLGYQICQPCKYLVGGRAKRPEEAADLLVRHPDIAEQRVPEYVLWETNDLAGIKHATICVYGWHADRIYPTTLDNLPEIVRFAAPDARRAACRRLGADAAAAILCLPQLPASTALKDRLLAQLRARGVDGVLCFRSILRELIARVDAGKNYHKSDILQVIRILKTYDLLQSQQMELFGRRKSTRRH